MEEKIKELIEELEEEMKEMEEEIKEIEELKFNAFDVKELIDTNMNYRFTRGCKLELRFVLDKLNKIIESEVENEEC